MHGRSNISKNHVIFMNLVNFDPKIFTQIIKCFDFIKFQSFMLKSKKKVCQNQLIKKSYHHLKKSGKSLFLKIENKT